MTASQGRMMSDDTSPDRSGQEAAHTVLRLLGDARAGHDDAFGRLFEAFRRHLLVVAHQELPLSLRGKVGPSDLVQETAVDARQGFPAFRGVTPEECFAWLRSILRNNVIDAIRRYEMSQKRSAGREVSLATQAGRREGCSLEMPHGLPDGSAIRREDAAILADAMSRLSSDHQAVLRLRYWEGLSFVEIASQFGRSPDAIRKLWYRAVERLQAEMHATSRGTADEDDSSGIDRHEPAAV